MSRTKWFTEADTDQRDDLEDAIAEERMKGVLISIWIYVLMMAVGAVFSFCVYFSMPGVQ